MSHENSNMTSPEISFDSRDEFNRRPIADKLINLIKSDIDVSPMIIDGNWGTGKSEFCTKLIKLLEEEADYQPVYIDAFKADHTDEPFLTILSSILKLVPEDEQPKLIQKIMPAVRFGLKATMKAGVSWILKQDAADLANDFDTDLKKAGDEIVNGSIQTLLSDHIKAEQNLETLTTVLKEISKDKPIIIFIDELDRCRPDFAVAILENIKHIFDIENVCFVLVTNIEQLTNSINHQYGVKLDAKQYLDKFVKFSFALPERYRFSQQPFKNAPVTHFFKLVENSPHLKASGITGQRIEHLLIILIRSNNLSLRQVETFIKHLEVYQVISNESQLDGKVDGWVFLKVIGVYLYVFQSKIVKDLKSEIVDASAICKLIGVDFSTPNVEDYLNDNQRWRWVTAIAWLIQLEDTVSRNPRGKTRIPEEYIPPLESKIQNLFGDSESGVGRRIEIVTEVFRALSFS